MKPEKIGFLETWNKESGIIEKSNGRRNQFMALVIGLVIALLSVTPFIEVTLGDAWPMVITLLGYSLGSTMFQKAIEINGEIKKPKT